MSGVTIHIRSEAPPIGRGVMLSPTGARQLIQEGYTINVERSSVRFHSDDEYKAVGANLVAPGSWVDAPLDHFILGVKQPPPEETFPLKHVHLYAGVHYRKQPGWHKVLKRYVQGGGTFLDLFWIKYATGINTDNYELLPGIGGAGLALRIWSHQILHPNGPPHPAIETTESPVYIKKTKEIFDAGVRKAGHFPRVIVVGARGRTGSAAISLLRQVGLPESNIIQWGSKDTSRPGPYEPILQSDILINAIFIKGDRGPPNPILDSEALHRPRKLSVVVDITCDMSLPWHALPVYTRSTTQKEPTFALDVPRGTPPITVASFPNWFTVFPKETCVRATNEAMPVLRQLKPWSDSFVLRKLEQAFLEKSAEAMEEDVHGGNINQNEFKTDNLFGLFVSQWAMALPSYSWTM